MHFHPILRDATESLFLFHVEGDDKTLKAAILVANPYMNDTWVAMSPNPGLEGPVFEVQMPAEIIGQPERYKGYDLNLPYRLKT